MVDTLTQVEAQIGDVGGGAQTMQFSTELEHTSAATSSAMTDQ
jgi:hypothetical protein